MALVGSAFWLEGYALCLALAALGVVLHEGGHVVGCLLTARSVLSVQIGSGPLLLSLRIAGVPVTIRCAPLSGLVRHRIEHPIAPVAARKARRFLLASIVVTAGGPVGNVLAIYLIQVASLHGLRHDIALIGVLNQVLALVWNLYPRTITIDRDGRRVSMPNDGRQLAEYLRSWALISRHPDRAFALAGASAMGIQDRDWYRQESRERRQATARRPFPFRLALLVGLFGTLLVGSILQGEPAHQFAGEIGSWWDAWRATPFPPLASSSLEDWLGANQLTNLIEINANCAAAGGFTVVRLHEASSGALAATGYLRQGDQVRFTLPPGSYILTFATGRGWIDPTLLFGTGTIYRRVIKALDVYVSQGGQERTVHNRTVWLCSPNGNLPTTPVGRDDF